MNTDDELDALLSFDLDLESLIDWDSEPTPAGEYQKNGQRTRIGLDRDPAQITETPRRRFLRIGREKAALEQIGRLPEPGEELTLILTGRWHGWDFVPAVLELIRPAKIDQLQIATLGFNKLQTQHLTELIDGSEIGSVRFLVSDMFKEKNRPEFEQLRNALESRRQIVATARNHAKLLLFKLDDGRTLAAHGSLNLRRCNSFEQLSISTDPALFDFFAAFISDAIAEAINP